MHDWVRESRGSFAVLLGAGASMPYLPSSYGLRKAVVNEIDRQLDPSNTDIANLWRFTRDVLARDDSLDIESFYTAAMMVGSSEEDPARFWVDRWLRIPENCYPQPPHRLYPNSVGVLQHFVIQAVFTILNAGTRSSNTDLSYLHPLLESQPCFLVTTNYDLFLETAASDLHLRLCTGIDEWNGPGTPWPSVPEQSTLLKLHGSIDWFSSTKSVGAFVRDGITTEPISWMATDDNLPLNPLIIFGAGNKLTPFGPFLPMLNRLEAALADVSLLVVIGYSFRDPHIDAVIHSWASLNDRRRVIVIDPVPRTDIPDIPMTGGGYESMLWAMWKDHPNNSAWARFHGNDRWHFVKAKAADAIADVFG